MPKWYFPNEINKRLYSNVVCNIIYALKINLLVSTVNDVVSQQMDILNFKFKVLIKIM